MTETLNILAFEAATQVCSVALCVNNNVFYRLEKTPRQSSNFLLPMIDEILNEASISLGDLHAIAAGHGPGSFMGVRLVSGVTKGLAFPNNIPVIGISTLNILAQTAYQKHGVKSVLCAWDARMHEIYYGVYRLNDEQIMKPVVADQLVAPHQLSLPDKYNTLVGNAWSVYYDEFSDGFKKQYSREAVQRAWIYPDARALLPIAKEKFSHKAYVSASDLEPVYLRNKVTG